MALRPEPTVPTPETQLGRSVSIERAAETLGVSRRTIYYWIRAGRLQTVRTLGGSQRVLLESLRECSDRGGAMPFSSPSLGPSPAGSNDTFDSLGYWRKP
jgi:excisionase family DNA binding protein